MEYWKLAADQTSHFYAWRIPSWIPSAFKLSLWFWSRLVAHSHFGDISTTVVVYLFWEFYYFFFFFAIPCNFFIIHLIFQHKSKALHLFAYRKVWSFSVLILRTPCNPHASNHVPLGSMPLMADESWWWEDMGPSNRHYQSVPWDRGLFRGY